MKNKKETWYSDQGRELKETTLLSLYARYYEHMGESLDRHFNIRNYYTVTLSLLLGGYVAGALQLAISKVEVAEWLFPYIALLMIPIITIALSVIGIMSTTRYYTAFLRMAALVAKIENMLGLDKQVKGEEKELKQLWKKDRAFMDEYYLRSRFCEGFESSKKFIEGKKWHGDNLWSTCTFGVFAVVSSVLLIWHAKLVWPIIVASLN